MARATIADVKVGDVGVWEHLIDKKTGFPYPTVAFDFDCYLIVKEALVTTMGITTFVSTGIADDGKSTKDDDTCTYDVKTTEWHLANFDIRLRIHFFDPKLLTAAAIKGAVVPPDSKSPITEGKVGTILRLYTMSKWPDGTTSYHFNAEAMLAKPFGETALVGPKDTKQRELSADTIQIVTNDFVVMLLAHADDKPADIWLLQQRNGKIAFNRRYKVVVMPDTHGI